MKTFWTIFLCVGFGTALSACSGDDEDDGGSDDGNPKFYCQVEQMGEVIGCNEHTVPEAALEASRDACTAGGGILVDACPTAGLIGTCRASSSGLVMHYYEAGGDAETAEEVCVTSLMGTWSTP